VDLATNVVTNTSDYCNFEGDFDIAVELRLYIVALRAYIVALQAYIKAL